MDKFVTEIRMKLPHHLAGRVLRRHDGDAYTIGLGAGLRVTIMPGDFVGTNVCMPRLFLKLNPHLWEPT